MCVCMGVRVVFFVGVGFGYVGIFLAFLLQFWGIDPKMSIVGSCGLGWSEKSESCNCQKFQAVSELRHHSEFRTLDHSNMLGF